MIVWTKPDELGDSLNGIRIIWPLKNSQKLLSPSFCTPPTNTSRRFISKMSTSSDFCSSSSSHDEYPLLTSAELSWLLLDQEMNFAVSTTFSSSPLSTVLLRQYLFLSHNLEWIQQDLTCHQLERESIFDVLSHSAPFQDIIMPIVLNFRLWQQQVSPVNPPPPFHASLNSPTSKHVERQSVIIQERSNSNDSLLSFYTPAYDEPGTRNNPINIDQLLDPSPLPPHIPVYTPPRTQLAPLLALCVADMVTLPFNVSGMVLRFVLTAKKLGIPYTIAPSCVVTNSDSTLTSRRFSSLVSLRANRGVMLQISPFYVCYHWTIFVINLLLLLLFHFCYHCYLIMIRTSFYYCYLLQLTIMQTLIMYKR